MNKNNWNNSWNTHGPKHHKYSKSHFQKTYPKIKRSYGIANCRYNLKTNRYEILMVKKRYTYYYVEFVLGHYSKNNNTRLVFLFNNMTNEEKVDILSLDFGQMWYRIWLINPESIYSHHDKRLTPEEFNKYAACKKQFERSFLVDHGERLRNLINKSTNVNTLWEIPKGRKSVPQEKIVNCAIREFKEETGIDASQYKILFDISPLKSVSSNIKVKYINYHYVAVECASSGQNSLHGLGRFDIEDTNLFNIDARLGNELWRRRRYNKNDKSLKIQFVNDTQISEVVEMKWMTLDEIKMVENPDGIYNMAKVIFKLLKKRKLGKMTRLGLLHTL